MKEWNRNPACTIKNSKSCTERQTERQRTKDRQTDTEKEKKTEKRKIEKDR